MKLFIWEGNGISDAYHNDGTLVVLAETPDAARAIVAGARRGYREQQERYLPLRRAYDESEQAKMRRGGWKYGIEFWHTPAGKEILQDRKAFEESQHLVDFGQLPDGPPEDGEYPDAMNREPDRVVELDTPCIVAFNGGGYD